MEAAAGTDLFTLIREAGIVTALVWGAYKMLGRWVSTTLESQQERAAKAEEALEHRLEAAETEAAELREQILELVRGEHAAKLEARDLAAQVAVGAAERRVLEVERDGAFAARDAAEARARLLDEKSVGLEEDVEALKRIIAERGG